MPIALVTGITGQDGSYLAELLLKKNYTVHGIIRRNSTFTSERIDHLLDDSRLKLHHGDLNDSSNIFSLVQACKPDEIYHLGAQSHVGVSFEVPEYTGDVSGLGTLRILNAIKSINKDIRFYNASTSEMFGGLVGSEPQNENTKFHPRSPYGAAKLYAHWLAINYREAFNVFAANGILFNHESPRRGKTFVTRKISIAVAKYALGEKSPLKLGNLDSIRDWGFAGDYVIAMWMMLQQNRPEDFVIATGIPCSVRRFVEMSFQVCDIEIDWVGSGSDELGRDKRTGKVLVEIDKRYFRPSEVEVLIGDPSKALSQLKWKATTSLSDLVAMMVNHDLENLSTGRKH